MTEILKTKILKIVKHPDYKPLRSTQLAKTLDIDPDNHEDFQQAIEQLRAAGHVFIGAKNLITLPPLASVITGTFRANPKGFGFIIPLDSNVHGDLFIPAKYVSNAMTGDIVTAKVLKKGARAGQMRYSGKITEVIQRANNRFVGTLRKTPQAWIVQPDGKNFLEPVAVDDVTAKNARETDKVLIEIISFPTSKYIAQGVIIEVLGKAGRYATEINSVIHQFQLPGEFPIDCIEQANDLAVEFDPKKSIQPAVKSKGRKKTGKTLARLDFSDKTIVTIDPPDSKDFDDAISIETDDQGNFVLGIHIADVAAFVTPDSPLDVEARRRGNSVYLPRKTIPMLPESLSNGLCSLQPGKLRFAKSALITYDADANVIKTSFHNSIIRSSERLTYLQADKILKGSIKNFSPATIALIKDMHSLAQRIETRRNKNGMLHLDLPETELIFDSAGLVIDAQPADDSYPHTIIEMFMVEANEAVASLLDRKNVPFIRRIHPDPDAITLQNLTKMLKAFGLPAPKKPNRFELQNILKCVKDKPISLAVNLVILKSLQRAEYSPLGIGHYALASKNYTHFTSPIRRYADLLVHRLLDSYIKTGSVEALLDSAELKAIGKQISFTETQAEKAESELKTVLILQMLSKKIGSTLDCVVSGLTSFGIFARCTKFGIEGLIRFPDLGPDDWKYNQTTQSVNGKISGTSIRLGQKITAKIANINIPARQLDLVPLEPFFDHKKIRKSQLNANTPRKKGQKYKSKSRRKR